MEQLSGAGVIPLYITELVHEHDHFLFIEPLSESKNGLGKKSLWKILNLVSKKVFGLFEFAFNYKSIFGISVFLSNHVKRPEILKLAYYDHV